MQKSDERSRLIIKLMIENELAIGKLYDLFSRRFEDTSFWQEIAREERIHAQWLEALYNSKDVYALKDGLYKPQVVEDFASSVNKEIESAQKYNLVEALSIAAGYERAFIEGKFFAIFESDSIDFNNIMAGLQKDTTSHLVMIEQELNRTKIALNMD